jgi:AbrB family looped-hinge helix DNA binding protein
MNKVGAKGQVVIDKAIRDQLGIEPGWVTVQRVVDGHVEITFLPPANGRSLLGRLAPYIKGPGAAGLSWEEIRERAWEQHVRERYGAGTPGDDPE